MHEHNPVTVICGQLGAVHVYANVGSCMKKVCMYRFVFDPFQFVPAWRTQFLYNQLQLLLVLLCWYCVSYDYKVGPNLEQLWSVCTNTVDSIKYWCFKVHFC